MGNKTLEKIYLSNIKNKKKEQIKQYPEYKEVKNG